MTALLDMDEVSDRSGLGPEGAGLAGPAAAGAALRLGRRTGLRRLCRRPRPFGAWKPSNVPCVCRCARKRRNRFACAGAEPDLRRRCGAGRHPRARPAAVRRPSAAGDEPGEDAVPLCDELMHAAIVRQASDIHIDPEEKQRAHPAPRRRRAGTVSACCPLAVHNGVISRFKVLGGMDIAEKRAPQDGHFTHRFGQPTRRSTCGSPRCRPSTASG